MDEKIPFYRSGYRSLLACKVKNFSTLPGLYMLREHEIFFLESRPVGRGCDGFVRTPPPTGCGGPFYTSPDTSRQKTKINSWIQFLPGQRDGSSMTKSKVYNMSDEEKEIDIESEEVD